MSVGRKALKSTIFVSFYTYLSFALTLLSNIFLARLLDPAHFGKYALALFFVELVGRVRELGLDQALTHRQKDINDSYKAHFTIQTGLYCLALIISVAAFPWLKSVYGVSLALSFITLSFLTLFQSLSCTPRIYLEKELAFGRTVLVDSLALTLSIALSIFLAWRGLGIWSLVWGNGAKILITFFGLYFVSGWRPGFIFDKKLLVWFLRFGGILWLGGLATFILFKYNDFILGTFVGNEDLGFYAKAISLAVLPTSLVTSAISRVSFPLYSQLQGDQVKLEKSFNLIVSMIARLGIPLSLLLFVTAKEFVLILLGEKWLPMVNTLRLLVGYSILRCIFDDVGAFLTSQGQPQLTVRYLCGQSVIFLGLAPLLTRWWGVEGAVVALNIVMLLGVVAAYWFAYGYVKFSPLKLFGGSVVSAAISLLLCLVIFTAPEFASWPIWLLFFARATLFSVIYCASLWFLEKNFLKADLAFFLEKAGLTKVNNFLHLK